MTAAVPRTAVFAMVWWVCCKERQQVQNVLARGMVWRVSLADQRWNVRNPRGQHESATHSRTISSTKKRCTRGPPKGLYVQGHKLIPAKAATSTIKYGNGHSIGASASVNHNSSPDSRWGGCNLQTRHRHIDSHS